MGIGVATRRLLFRGVDIELSMYPSFLYPLFKKRGPRHYVKVLGYGGGVELRQVGRLAVEVIAPAGVDELWARAVTGVWLDPGEHLDRLSGYTRIIVEHLLRAYPGLRIVASPKDWVYVFISAFLSRNTDFHVNTVRWVRGIAGLYEDPRDIVEDPGRLEIVGRSYQLLQLPEALSLFLRMVSPQDCAKPDRLRRKLLTIPYVGPKVADSYLLFACMASSAVPVDKNLLTFLRLVVGVEGVEAPTKVMCMRSSSCINTVSCPYASSCAAAAMKRLFGPLAGWVQTASYLHVKRWCRRGRCSGCLLRALCRRRVLEEP